MRAALLLGCFEMGLNLKSSLNILTAELWKEKVFMCFKISPNFSLNVLIYFNLTEL